MRPQGQDQAVGAFPLALKTVLEGTGQDQGTVFHHAQ
jgi:hypothetical protein